MSTVRTGRIHLTRKELLELHDKLSQEAKELMVKKNHDYGADSDPFRNFRQFGALGILVRMSDKLARLQSFLENGKFLVEDEGVDDTTKDILNYSVLLNGFLKDEINGNGRGLHQDKDGNNRTDRSGKRKPRTTRSVG